MSPRRILTFAFLALIVCYALFQARFLIVGPNISVGTPGDGVIVDASPLEVTGTARNITELDLDGRPISIDGQGRFSEKLLLAPGTSIITLDARDRFGRKTEKQLRVVYNN